MEIKELFPVAILKHHIDKDMADTMENEIVPLLDNLERNTPILDSVGDEYISADTMYTDFWENKIPVHEIVPDFWDVVRTAAYEYADQTSYFINPNFKVRYWTQNYVKQDRHDIHQHGINGISGTYFIRANENAGPIRFYNPNNTAEYVRAGNPLNKFVQGHHDIWPEKGLLLLFPSYIKHAVESGRNDDVVRTSISFDCCPGV